MSNKWYPEYLFKFNESYTEKTLMSRQQTNLSPQRTFSIGCQPTNNVCTDIKKTLAWIGKCVGTKHFH